MGLEVKVRATNLILQIGRHVAVQQGNDVGITFHDGHVHPPVVKRLRHFHANEAASDHDRVLWLLLIQIRDNPVHVRDIPQGADMGKLHAGNRRNNGLGPLAEDQLVVGDIRNLTIRSLHGDRLGRPINREHLVIHVSLDPKSHPKALRGHDDQLGAVIDLARDEVGETAVGKGDIGPALKDMDFRFLVRPPCLGCGRSSPGNSADNEDTFCLHDGAPSF